MTRINLIPVEELSDQHLFAEFREIKMVPKSLRRSLNAASKHCGEQAILSVLAKIPEEYCLGKGHVSFFYNKGAYLHKRYSDICLQLQKRGINHNINSPLDPDHIFWDHPKLGQNYIPTEAALALIRARIAEKIAMKPLWYRWTAPAKNIHKRSVTGGL